jgi:hypothetical protein
MGSRVWAAPAGALALLTAHLAAADEPTAAQKDSARALMDAGRASENQGDHRTALDRFRAADAIMHVPTTGYEVAHQQAALGMLVEARDTALRVIHFPAEEREPAPFARARERAQALLDELAPRIPALTISIANADKFPGAQVAVDGVGLPVAALAVPYKVNPGHHVVSAVGESARAEREVDVAEGSLMPIELTMTVSVAAEPAGIEAAAPEQPASQRPGSSAAVWLRWGGLGLAVVGAGTGAVTGIMSLSSTSSAKAKCPGDQCPPAAWGDLHTAQTTATIADVAFAAAGVGAAAFVTSFLIGGSKDPAPPTDPASKDAAGLRLAPWIGGTAAGVAGVF